MERPEVFDSYNAGYAQLLYERYLRDPMSVDDSWRRLFASGAAQVAGLIEVEPGRWAAAAPSAVHLRTAMAAGELVDAYRLNGHFAAKLDPLGSDPSGHPMLDPEFHGITSADLHILSASLVNLSGNGATLEDVLSWLRRTYTGPIGYEYEHIQEPERRNWMREQIESWGYRRALGAEEQRRLLTRLSEVEAFEQFLHRAYLGHKRFSIEGTDMLVPMLDLAIESAAAAGAHQVVLGMAHRGRLNVLAHVLGRPYRAILAEFEGQHAGIGTGDVKYHLGAVGTYATISGEPLNVMLAPNPSHLEFVDPVIVGIARAKQTRRSGRELVREEHRVLPIQIHGDAAFSAQGVVAETLNLAKLEGYRTGGSVHFIVNNQVGFTTEPAEGRSTRYASDLALGFDVPIFHVNADDPEACLAVVRLALDYRTRFCADVVIDLIGYRRYGHNEGDEPAYTQPLMYQKIAEHPSVRKLWADRLVTKGLATEKDVQAAWDAAYERLIHAQEEVQQAGRANGGMTAVPPPAPVTPVEAVDTTIPADRLLSLDGQLHEWPEAFHVNPKLARQLKRRATLLEKGQGIDWAHAETLAFASLLADGVPVRMSGQDSVRGTFSQRHLALHDIETGARYLPIQHIAEATAPFEVYNSPLSEIAVLGFEYGYSTVAPDALVLWEAQFGDFVNVAQVIIDQFIAAGREKWGQLSRLVLLLPHGYEGQGPEHSSGRLERFLVLAAEHNLCVAYPTTPAQYFHLLRKQAMLDERRPLVVMTPKSLLRHPRAVSKLEAFTDRSFAPVLPEDDAPVGEDATRLLLCSGKIYYDLTGSEDRERATDTAIARVAELYPFPRESLAETLAAYANLEEIVWVQEEPRNMGAWRYMEPRLRALVGDGRHIGYVGRPERASPAEGYARMHEIEQARIVRDALAVQSPKADRPVRRTEAGAAKGSS